MHYALFFWFIGISCAIAQQGPPDYIFHNLTTSDGLLSNQCHGIVTDNEGFIWVAMDGGLMRFDGCEFRSFGEDSGLQNETCIHLVKDAVGNLWINTVSGNIYIKDRITDSVKLIPCNSEIRSMLEENFGFSRVFEIDKTGNLHMIAHKLGAGFVVDSLCNVAYFHNSISPPTIIIQSFQENRYYGIPIVIDQEGLRISVHGLTKVYYDQSLYVPYKVIHKDYSFYLDYNPDFDLIPGVTVFPLRHDTIVISGFGIQAICSDQRLIKQNKDAQILDVISMQDGSFFFGMHGRNGLRWYRDIQAVIERKYTTILENVTVTSVETWGRSSIVISTIESGIFILKKKTIYPILKGEEITYIESNDSDHLYYGNKEKVSLFEIENNQHRVLFEAISEVRDVNYSASDRELFISSVFSNRVSFNTGISVMPLRRKAHYGKNARLGYSRLSVDARKIHRLNQDTILAISSTSWLLFNHLDSLPFFSSEKDADREYIRFNDGVSMGEGIVFASDTGLVVFRNQQYEAFKDFGDLPKMKVNSLVKIEDRILVGYPKVGLIMASGFGILDQLNLKEDIPGSYLNRVVQLTDSTLFLCHNEGLSRLTIKGDSLQILYTMTVADGLLSGNVYDVCVLGDKLYIATASGINYMDVNSYPVDTPQIGIEFVNGIPRRELEGRSFRLRYNEELQIYFSAVTNYYDPVRIYRYRLNSENWTYTENASARYSSLRGGDYTFEVAIQNIKGDWNTTDTFHFAILPPFYAQQWFLFLSGIMIIGGLVFYFRTKAGRIRKESQIQEEMRSLERQAIKAQMNPHFIFNCLNSIQNYIMDNDKLAAMDYLSKFARLIRQSLIASAESSISLSQEVQMMELYLELEKMRFKDKFSYEVSYSSSRDMASVYIPPLLVQPIVENAVIHGMKGIHVGGLIKVDYVVKGGHIEVTVSDNGAGMEHFPSKNGHSYGMSLTKRRLQLLSALDKSAIQIESGKEGGTTVRLWIETEKQ